MYLGFYSQHKLQVLEKNMGRFSSTRMLSFMSTTFPFPPCFNQIYKTQVKFPPCLIPLILPLCLHIYYLMSLSQTPCTVLLLIRLYQITSHHLRHNLTSQALRPTTHVLRLPMHTSSLRVPLAVLDL